MAYDASCSCLLLCCLLLADHFQESLQLQMRRVSIPPAVEADAPHAILDCDYSLGNTSSRGLVVKWFLNDVELVYQWIYGSPPQATEPLHKYVDLRYRASEEPYAMYRAVKLLRPGVELSGNYSCVVSTFQDERSARAPMIVYSTGRQDEFKLWRTEQQDGGGAAEMTCQALGLYPKPSLDIRVDGYPDLRSTRPLLTETEQRHFNIVAHLVLQEDELADDDSVVVNCVLRIPSVGYNATKKIVHYPPGRPTTTGAAAITGTTNLLRKLEIQPLEQAGAAGGNSASRTIINVWLILINVAGYAFLRH